MFSKDIAIALLAACLNVFFHHDWHFHLCTGTKGSLLATCQANTSLDRPIRVLSLPNRRRQHSKKVFQSMESENLWSDCTPRACSAVMKPLEQFYAWRAYKTVRKEMLISAVVALGEQRGDRKQIYQGWLNCGSSNLCMQGWNLNKYFRPGSDRFSFFCVVSFKYF